MNKINVYMSRETRSGCVLQAMPERIHVCALDGSQGIRPYDSPTSYGTELLAAVLPKSQTEDASVCFTRLVSQTVVFACSFADGIVIWPTKSIILLLNQISVVPNLNATALGCCGLLLRCCYCMQLL